MSNIFMKINGIDGDVSAKDHKEWIALSSLSTKNSRTIVSKVGKMSDREGTTPQFHEIEIQKRLDSASNGLFQQSCTPKAISEVEIHICTTDAELSPYFKLTLSDVLISEHVMHASEDVKPFESIRLSFSKIQRTFISRDKNNKSTSPDIVGYDLAKAQMV